MQRPPHKWWVLACLALLGLIRSILIAHARGRKRARVASGVPSTTGPSPRAIQVGDSEVHLYTHGHELYPAMLQAIRQARARILLDTFIWKADAAGLLVKQELQRAAERGISVWIIYDRFANLVVPRSFKRFPSSIAVLAYPLRIHPWPPWPLWRVLCCPRDHHKLLVVDGQHAFVGGYNLGVSYASTWRDTHVGITGPDAGQLENFFIDFWNTYHHSTLPALSILPDLDQHTWPTVLHLQWNDPPLLRSSIRSSYLEAIAQARSHIYLTQAYFIPDYELFRALLSAAWRGVDVRLLLPAASNHMIADWLARAYYTRCLQAGIRVLLYQPTVLHAKTATIDGRWSTIGTANLDCQSLRNNFEVNVVVRDEALAQQMEAIFTEDTIHCQEMTLAQWQHRPQWWKILERLLRPLRPLF